MNITVKGLVVGALAVAGATLATAEAQAMPIGPLAPVASEAHVEQVYYYGYRRPLIRFGYGYRRPFLRYRRFGYRPYGFGFRRPFYGYRRPFYGYGYRRF